MKSLRVLLYRLAGLIDKEGQDQELTAELEAHLDLHTEDNMRLGMNAEDARRAAVLKLGGVEATKERYRDRRSLMWLEIPLQNLRFAFRGLRMNPRFTFVAILTLALGIGLVTSVFSVVNTTLLQSLPYGHADRIMTVARTSPRFDHPVPLSGADFLDWRARAHSFSEMAAYGFRNVTRTGAAAPEQVPASAVSASFFSVLGVSPLMGRGWRAEEDHPGGNHVVILSDALWKDWFGGRAEAVGQSLLLDGETYTVIGVMPAEFRFEDAPNAKLWIPLVLEPGQDRGNHMFSAVGTLASGVTIRQAQAEMDVIAGQLQREYPHEDAEQGIFVFPFQDRITSVNRDVVLMFFAAVVLVLLIACTNVAGLVLARSVSRQKATALRAALGAGRWRIIAEFVTESVLLSLGGGCVGIALAYVLTPLLRAQTFIYLPRAYAITVNGRVLLFALGLSILTGVACSLAPAWRLSQVDLNDVLKSSSGGTGKHRWSLRSVLVAGQIALSLMLVTGTGLLVESMLKVLRTNPGYQTDHLLTFWITLPPNRYRDHQKMDDATERILENARRLSGVRSAGMTTMLPPSGWEDDGGFLIVGHGQQNMHDAPDTYVDAVSPDFFSTLGIALVRGRFLTAQDNRPDGQKVVVISRTLADQYFREEDPVGRQMKFEEDDGKNAWTIVGVVRDTRYFGWDHDTGVVTYFPYRALGGRAHWALTLRTAGSPSALVPAAEHAVWAVDRDLPLLETASMQERMNQAFAPWRFNAVVVGGFGVAALFLSSLGIFGLLSYLVVQRTKEIGVRLALGATRGDVLRFVVKRALIVTLLGIGCGLPCSLGVAFLLKGLLYGTEPLQATVFVVAPVILVLTGVLSALWPGRIASSVDPMIALRAM